MADRTAILTGVTGGWGRAVLDRFLDRGWNVCATDARRPTTCRTACWSPTPT